MYYKKIIAVLFCCLITSLSLSFGAGDKYQVEGYWLQKDKAATTNVSIVKIYKNDSGNVNAKIVVPLSDIEGSQVNAPMVYCKKCGKGDAYGNKYDYVSGKQKYQGIEFAWNAHLKNNLHSGNKGPLYDGGAVLNPHDGKYYHLKAQTINNGKNIYVRAYINSWFGKTEYWERISKTQANKVRKLCGLTSKNRYTYQNKNLEITNKKLFDECIGRDFAHNPL